MIERAVDANTQWQKDTRGNHDIQGFGGLSAIPAARASTDHSPCLHSGVGIVGEFVRHGKFDNRLSAASQVKRKFQAQAPMTSVQVSHEEPTLVEIDSSGCPLRRGVRLPSSK